MGENNLNNNPILDANKEPSPVNNLTLDPDGMDTLNAAAQEEPAQPQNAQQQYQQASQYDQQQYQQAPQYDQQQYQQAPQYGQQPPYEQKSKMAAGLLGIFLGAFGVHNFYLGKTGLAVTQLLITVLSCFMLCFVSEIWGLIEGIMILTGSINVDGKGVPLKD